MVPSLGYYERYEVFNFIFGLPDTKLVKNETPHVAFHGNFDFITMFDKKAKWQTQQSNERLKCLGKGVKRFVESKLSEININLL